MSRILNGVHVVESYIINGRVLRDTRSTTLVENSQKPNQTSKFLFIQSNIFGGFQHLD